MNENMKRIIIDDMFLTTDSATTAGSGMLEGYQSPIEATVIQKAQAAGYTLAMKTPVGEFAIDLLGETAASGAWMRDGVLKNATAKMLYCENAKGALCLDVNGYPRRAAAQTGLVCLKPTYDAISRQGVVSVAPSGETVDILAKEVEDKLRDVKKSITVAVMGCVVNGPGEAREADIGIAGGDGCAVIFKKGEVLRKVQEESIVEELFKEIELL